MRLVQVLQGALNSIGAPGEGLSVYILWLWLTWTGASAITYAVLRSMTQWKPGRLVAICAVRSPVGLIVFLAALWSLVQAGQTVTATMSLFVPGTVATAILALSLRALGVRPANWYQLIALIVTLFAVSAAPFTVLVRIAARSLEPGW